MNETTEALKLFTDIAKALDASHHFAPQAHNSGWGTLTLPDGVQLHLRFGGYGNEGRVEVSGSFPFYTDAQGQRHVVTPRDIYENGSRLPSPSITVSLARPVETIAHEIKSRLLVRNGLSVIWAKCKARADATTASYRDQKDLVRRIAEETRGEVDQAQKTISYGFEIGEAAHRGGYGDTPHHFDVTLRNVSPRELAEVLTVVRAARGL